MVLFTRHFCLKQKVTIHFFSPEALGRAPSLIWKPGNKFLAKEGLAAQAENDPKRCTSSLQAHHSLYWKKMPPKVEARSIRRKKRKFTGNRFTRNTNSTESELAATEKRAKSSEDSLSEASSDDDCKQIPSSAKHPSTSFGIREKTRGTVRLQ